MKDKKFDGEPVNRNKIILRSFLLLSCLAIVFISARNLPAGFSRDDNSLTYVEIEGINYGTFSQISGLENIPFSGFKKTSGPSYVKVSLNRDFVTDPSLYLWAKNLMQRQSILKNIHIITIDRYGHEVARKVLYHCQPLTWSVESANPGVGGFHERIELAVQEISIQ